MLQLVRAVGARARACGAPTTSVSSCTGTSYVARGCFAGAVAAGWPRAPRSRTTCTGHATRPRALHTSCPVAWRGGEVNSTEARSAAAELGMEPNTPLDLKTVKAAFRAKALASHPDTSGVGGDAEFKKATDNYKLLLEAIATSEGTGEAARGGTSHHHRAGYATACPARRS